MAKSSVQLPVVRGVRRASHASRATSSSSSSSGAESRREHELRELKARVVRLEAQLDKGDASYQIQNIPEPALLNRKRSLQSLPGGSSLGGSSRRKIFAQQQHHIGSEPAHKRRSGARQSFIGASNNDSHSHRDRNGKQNEENNDLGGGGGGSSCVFDAGARLPLQALPVRQSFLGPSLASSRRFSAGLGGQLCPLPAPTQNSYAADRRFFPTFGYAMGETVDRLVSDCIVGSRAAKQIRVLLAADDPGMHQIMAVYEKAGSGADAVAALRGRLRVLLRARAAVAQMGGGAAEAAAAGAKAVAEYAASVAAPAATAPPLPHHHHHHHHEGRKSQRQRPLLPEITVALPGGSGGGGSGGGGGAAGSPYGASAVSPAATALTLPAPFPFVTAAEGAPSPASSTTTTTATHPYPSPALGRVWGGIVRGLLGADPMRPRVLLVSLGAFNPINKLHLRLLYLARHYLEDHHGVLVIGGVLSPSHATLVRLRHRTRACEIIPPRHRLAMARAVAADSSWLAVDPWEVTRKRVMERMAVMMHCREALLAAAPPAAAAHAVRVLCLCEPSQALQLNPALLREGGFGIVTVCRPLEAQRVRQELGGSYRDVAIVVEDTAILSVALEKHSSRTVRQCMAQGRPIEGMCGAAVARYAERHGIGDKVAGKVPWGPEDKTSQFDCDDRPYNSLPPQILRRRSQQPLQH